MRIRKNARKWVLNLWTIALVVLSATGLNPFESMGSPPVQSPVIRNVETWIDISSGPDSQYVLSNEETSPPLNTRWTTPSSKRCPK